MVRLSINERHILYAVLTVETPEGLDGLTEAVGQLKTEDKQLERELEGLKKKLEGPEFDDDAVTALITAVKDGSLVSPEPYFVGKI